MSRRGLWRQVSARPAISESEWSKIDLAYYPNMLKRFSEWFGLKKKLHERQQTPPLVFEREVWWASVGENVGSEINGKSALFSRPVIIYKKLSHGFYFVIPTTTQKKEGNWFVHVRYQRTDMTACLHQARAIDHRRLSSRLDPRILSTGPRGKMSMLKSRYAARRAERHSTMNCGFLEPEEAPSELDHPAPYACITGPCQAQNAGPSRTFAL
jgi:mRNA interferase MazF